MGDGFYRSKDQTNSIKVLKEHIYYTINTKIQQSHINTKHSSSMSQAGILALNVEDFSGAMCIADN